MGPAPRSDNRLLAALPQPSYDQLAGHLRPVTLRQGHVLHRPGAPIQDLYFPLDCLVSITVTMHDGRTSETGVVGRRGLAGLTAVLGNGETTRTASVVQVPGTALCVAAARAREAFTADPGLRDVVLRYTQALLAQVTQNAACRGLHTVAQRFARWLLEVRDRIPSDDVRLTHAFIAQLLGVRRAGITELGGLFEAEGLVAQRRNQIRIVDRAGLETHACECYRVVRDEYDRLLGGDGGRPPSTPSPPWGAPAAM